MACLDYVLCVYYTVIVASLNAKMFTAVVIKNEAFVYLLPEKCGICEDKLVAIC